MSHAFHGGLSSSAWPREKLHPASLELLLEDKLQPASLELLLEDKLQPASLELLLEDKLLTHTRALFSVYFKAVLSINSSGVVAEER